MNTENWQVLDTHNQQTGQAYPSVGYTASENAKGAPWYSGFTSMFNSAPQSAAPQSSSAKPSYDTWNKMSYHMEFSDQSNPYDRFLREQERVERNALLRMQYQEIERRLQHREEERRRRWQEEWHRKTPEEQEAIRQADRDRIADAENRDRPKREFFNRHSDGSDHWQMMHQLANMWESHSRAFTYARN